MNELHVRLNILRLTVTQEVLANAMNDESRQAFKAEKRRIASQKKAAQATSTNKLSTDRPFVSTGRPFVSTDRSNTPNVSVASTSIGANADESSFIYLGGKIPIDASTLPNVKLPIDPNMPNLEDASDTLPNDRIFNEAYDDDEDVGFTSGLSGMIFTHHGYNYIDVNSFPHSELIRHIPRKYSRRSFISSLTIRTNHKDQQNCLFACFLSQEEPKTISQALKDESWVEAMQEELLQFKLQQVWILVDLPFGKKAIGTKWVFRNKRDERSIVVKNKARLVAQGHRQEEGIDYDEVFAPVADIGQSGCFVDPAHPNKVYKVVKALYGLHQAPRAWYETLSSFLLENEAMVFEMLVTIGIMHKRFQMSSMGELTFFLGLQVKQQPDGIFISQDKYVADILKKFDFCSIKTATTPIESNKPLVKDKDGVEVDLHEYRSMIGSLMYLTASRQDIMFAVCACARDSPFELEAFSDSDYTGVSLDRKSTTGGYQFLGRRLISWQCKKQTIMANSNTEAKYVAAAHCCRQNSVYHSRTKHIEIRHHFIRDCYEKRLIDVLKIHNDSNVADLLTKGFDAYYADRKSYE
ncbi:putative ribonuclease H-like domain-containing protein [Tanacetum coccineum]